MTNLIDENGSCSGRADVWTFYMRRWGNHFFRSDAGVKIEVWGRDSKGEAYLKKMKYGQRFVEREEGNTVYFEEIKE